MLASPFAFYRGTAALQAADMAREATTGQPITICGDAHVGNFGLYASPQRSMVFDLNDFDEAAYGPWEWDVKRFVTSVVIAAQHNGLPESTARDAAQSAAASYRAGLRDMMKLEALERYYLSGEVTRSRGKRRQSSQLLIDRALAAGKRRTAHRVVKKITVRNPDGSLSIVLNPPTLMRVPEATEELVAEIYAKYCQTVSPDIAVLLAHYRIADIARRVVGVGSVGTRCSIAILEGPANEPLVLQVKQAALSVVNEYGGIDTELSPEIGRRAAAAEPGFRVTASQRILQAVSDPFLGFVTLDDRAFYIRQFRDHNVSFDLETLDAESFADYVDACAVTLARAHAQSPNAAFIAGYLGSGGSFDNAMARWATSYARQSLADYQALVDAVNSGRLGA